MSNIRNLVGSLSTCDVYDRSCVHIVRDFPTAYHHDVCLALDGRRDFTPAESELAQCSISRYFFECRRECRDILRCESARISVTCDSTTWRGDEQSASVWILVRMTPSCDPIRNKSVLVYFLRDFFLFFIFWDSLPLFSEAEKNNTDGCDSHRDEPRRIHPLTRNRDVMESSDY